MRIPAVLLAVVVALSPAGAFAARPTAARPRTIDELRQRIARVLEEEQVPGVGIALVAHGETLWAGGVGLADVERRTPVGADTLFRVGSITKSVVSLGILKLVEQGRIDLDARVADLAPELTLGNRWAAQAPITVAQLLEHTAGFDDMHPNETYGPLSLESQPLAEMLARNPRSRVARWTPGSRFSYANPGYTVAAYLIEKITGRSYEDYLRDEILEPLGMRGAALRLTPDVDARLSRGYDGPLFRAVPYHAIYHRPAGNLMASPRELAALVKMFLRRGRVGDRALVSPASIERMERSGTARIHGFDGEYGLGNYSDDLRGVVSRGHDGGIDGFISCYRYLPGHDAGFVMLLNSTGPRVQNAYLRIRQLLVDHLLGDTKTPAAPRVTVPVDELRAWEGFYHPANPRMQLFAFLERTILPDVRLWVEEGRLYFGIPGFLDRVEMVPVGEGRFRFPFRVNKHLILARDAGGRRVLTGDIFYAEEEPRWRAMAFYWGARIVFLLLLTALLLPLGAGARRLAGRDPSGPGWAWPFLVGASFVATPWVFMAGAQSQALGDLNGYTVGICALTWTFAIASAATALQSLRWLRRPVPWITRAHRLLLAAAACAATIFLAVHGIVGLRLWSY
jgi:CubicO group peptidase (beta-lactamase class C family)